MQKTMTLLAAGAALAALPALAHAQAGHPDFTGVWTIAGYTGFSQSQQEFSVRTEFEDLVAFAALDRAVDEPDVALPVDVNAEVAFS